ncbi:MAG TPA: DUF5996 family protein [Terriglobales bacterium]|nr:DUF5996 family protein [Terriglobales bacterium]
MSAAAWPELPYAGWKDTCATLHRWLQIAGKVRLALAPHINHFWQATFYLAASGLTSSAIPLPGGSGIFEIQFDFLRDQARIVTSRGEERIVKLRPCSVAEFEKEFLGALRELGIGVKIWEMPVEIAHPVRFNLDEEHCSYDGEAVRRWWRILVECERVLLEFRSGFQGKCSPVHLFWGSLDLAVTRFSGRRAPERPGADAMTREAYSHEVSSVGFWPGNDDFPDPAFYAYAAPAPEGFAQARVGPAAAFYSSGLGEFLLKYEDVRRASSPRATLLEFCQSSYLAAAELGRWDRAALERGYSTSKSSR